MNHFEEKFNQRIKDFWNNFGEIGKQKLFDDILQYANTNPETFKKEIEEIRYDKDLLPLPIVLQSLSMDTASWGQFYADLLDDIFETAKKVEKPNDILTNLTEFAHIEKDDKPFVQKIVDRLCKELHSDNLYTKLATICIIPGYLNNTAIKNKRIIVEALQEKLTDKNWKVRVVTFKTLDFENLLPLGHK